MRAVSSVLASAVALSFLAATANAKAQEASPTGKGVTGGALLGGELVLAIEAAFGVESTWAYIGGGLAGAAAGGVGGYFIEQNSSARYPMLMLAGGLTLAIPTTVAVLSATAYEPPATYVQDQPPTDEPVANPPTAPAATPATPPATLPERPPATTPETTPPSSPPPSAPSPQSRLRERPRKVLQRRASLPPAILDIAPTRLSLSVPAVEIRDVFTRAEVAMGAPKGTEVRIPVLNVLF